MPTASAPAFIDIEASGFGRGSYPIEIGFVDPQGQLFCTLVQPQADWSHWDEQAAALHGIARELLDSHGKPCDWVAAQLNQRLAGQTVYCDGWGQDYPWLQRLFEAAEQAPSFRLEDLRTLLSESEAAAWHGVVRRVREELSIGRHRASSDAKVLQIALQRLRTPP
ncbi:hypothetical protein HNQ51_000524 [Inhella inkyongensis]|uniref:Exonuclease domain-containing protein n=1 Tax=Inhella inkyongensis TaxID=392593 RepID=A0A840S3I7_9BURK|nr:hypothetical protein [Inhella inkyongensis]MBB5203231.1 hypothetical protein [Inhella inkyongensis]